MAIMSYFLTKKTHEHVSCAREFYSEVSCGFKN